MAASALNGGALSLASYGSVAVNAPITTAANIVVSIDTGGSIQVNAPITAAMNGSGPGAIVLTANDPGLEFFDGLSSNNNGNGITGSGLLTAGTINLAPALAGRPQRQHRQSGPALQVTSDTGLLSLASRHL